MEKPAVSKLNKLLLAVFGILLLAILVMGVYYFYYLQSVTRQSEADKSLLIEGVDLNDFPAIRNKERVVQETERSSRGVLAGVKENKIYLGGAQGYLRPIALATDTLYSCQKKGNLNIFIDYRNIDEVVYREQLLNKNLVFGNESEFWEKVKPGEVVLVILKKSSAEGGERIADFVYWLSDECPFSG